jgi:hypothetical protein
MPLLQASACPALTIASKANASPLDRTLSLFGPGPLGPRHAVFRSPTLFVARAAQAIAVCTASTVSCGYASTTSAGLAPLVIGLRINSTLHLAPRTQQSFPPRIMGSLVIKGGGMSLDLA